MADHTLLAKLSSFFDSPFFWGAVGLVAGVSIMQLPTLTLAAAWLALVTCIWRTDFFHDMGKFSRLGDSTLCLVCAVLLFVLSRHLPISLAPTPSMDINQVELHTEPSANKVCLVATLRNTGTALAHTQMFQHDITINGVLYPVLGSNNGYGDFAANGGISRYQMCVANGKVIKEVEDKKPIFVTLGFRYRGDSGPTYTYCVKNNRWDYDANSLAGNDGPCDPNDRTPVPPNNVIYFATIILGALILSVPVSLVTIWLHAAWQHGASWRDNADEF